MIHCAGSDKVFSSYSIINKIPANSTTAAGGKCLYPEDIYLWLVLNIILTNKILSFCKLLCFCPKSRSSLLEIVLYFPIEVVFFKIITSLF